MRNRSIKRTCYQSRSTLWGVVGVLFLTSSATVDAAALRPTMTPTRSEHASFAPAHGDPSEHVARLRAVTGDVRVGPSPRLNRPATPNRPVSKLDFVETGSNSTAELVLHQTYVWLAPLTKVMVLRLDDEAAWITMEGGSIAVRAAEGDQRFQMGTGSPVRKIIHLRQGWMRVDAAQQKTTVLHTGRDTAATVEIKGVEQTVGSEMRWALSSPAGPEAAGAQFPDPFGAWVSARDEERASRVHAAHASDVWQHVHQKMIGAEELVGQGEWQQHAEYGPVFVPSRVSHEWAPYRYGAWVFAEPFGWSWADQATWAFAPSHYGRWVLLGTRWAWAPGRKDASPVYAPALVAWGQEHAPTISWLPLTVSQAWLAPYPCSFAYLERLNAPSAAVTPVQASTPAVFDLPPSWPETAISSVSAARFFSGQDISATVSPRVAHRSDSAFGFAPPAPPQGSAWSFNAAAHAWPQPIITGPTGGAPSAYPQRLPMAQLAWGVDTGRAGEGPRLNGYTFSRSHSFSRKEPAFALQVDPLGPSTGRFRPMTNWKNAPNSIYRYSPYPYVQGYGYGSRYGYGYGHGAGYASTPATFSSNQSSFDLSVDGLAPTTSHFRPMNHWQGAPNSIYSPFPYNYGYGYPYLYGYGPYGYGYSYGYNYGGNFGAYPYGVGARPTVPAASVPPGRP